MPPTFASHFPLRLFEHLGREVDAGDLGMAWIRRQRKTRPDTNLEDLRPGRNVEATQGREDAREEEASEDPIVEMGELVVDLALVRLGSR